MTSLPRIVANQANAQLSSGPRTEEGKLKVRHNAITHGLSSKQLVLASEDQADFDELRAALFVSWRPAGEKEAGLVAQLAEDRWRLMRARRTETAFLNQCIQDIRKEHGEQLTPDEALGMIFTLKPEMNKMRLFLRYQTAAERAYNRTLTSLQREQKLRGQEADEIPQPLLPEPVVEKVPVQPEPPAQPAPPRQPKPSNKKMARARAARIGFVLKNRPRQFRNKKLPDNVRVISKPSPDARP